MLEWLADHAVDVLGLQETKLIDENFPVEAFEEAGYHAYFSGQKTYNGVALISKQPLANVCSEAGFDDPQRRFISGRTAGVEIINIYVPNGAAVTSDKYQYKLRWLDQLHRHLSERLQAQSKLLVMGDFNIAPLDADVHDPALWEGKILCSSPEREAFGRLLALGMVDTYRLFPQPAGQFSWWDYRAAAYRRNHGLRIDLLLASTALAEHCSASYIDAGPRGKPRPSDHAPVIAEFTD